MTRPNPTTSPAEGGDSVPTQLLAAVEHLSDAVSQLATRLRWVVVGGIVTMVVAVFSLVLYVQLRDTQNELSDTIDRVSETRMDVLCPLYGVFLASYDPLSEAAQQNPEQYEAAFDVIREGAVLLGCPVAPPT